MDERQNNYCTKQAIPSSTPRTIHGVLHKRVSQAIKAMRNQIAVAGTARYASCCLWLRFLQLFPELVLFVTNIAQVTLKKG